jgi:hypothetical protein
MADNEKTSEEEKDTDKKKSAEEEASKEEGKRYTGGAIPRGSRAKKNED